MNRPKTRTSKSTPFTKAERLDISRYIALHLMATHRDGVVSLIDRFKSHDHTWKSADNELLLPLLRLAISVCLPRHRIRRIDSMSHITWLNPLLIADLEWFLRR